MFVLLAANGEQLGPDESQIMATIHWGWGVRCDREA